jgi:hypothetical protein
MDATPAAPMSDFDAAPAFDRARAFDAAPAFDRARAFDAASAFGATPGFDASGAYDPGPDVDPTATARPPRPWLMPVLVGSGVAIASVLWWISIYETPPCRVQTVGFGLLALIAFGIVAMVGVWFAIDSDRVRPRRRGKALLLGGLAAMGVFLALTTVLPWVLPAC